MPEMMPSTPTLYKPGRCRFCGMILLRTEATCCLRCKHDGKVEQEQFANGYDRGYSQGFLDGGIWGITRYAWWMDGEQRVGCGITTLIEALDAWRLEFSPDDDDTV